MNNFLITQNKNYFPITIPCEYIQEQKEIKINKIIFYPKVEEKNISFIIYAKRFTDQNLKVYTFNYNLYDDNIRLNPPNQLQKINSDQPFDINDNSIISVINHGTFSFRYGVIDNYLELTNMNFIDNRNWHLEENGNFGKIVIDSIRILINNQEYTNFHGDNLLEAFIRINLIPCEFLKIYVTYSSSNSMEIQENGTQKYTNLITIKKPISMPIEITEDEFPYQTNVASNSIFYITDENDKMIDIQKIYLFYSLY